VLELALMSLAIPKSANRMSGEFRCLLPPANEEARRLDILVSDLMVVSMLERIRRLIDDMGRLLRQKQCFPSSLAQPVSAFSGLLPFSQEAFLRSGLRLQGEGRYS
jgi:hypothetical protein